jgi:hypothetical protein
VIISRGEGGENTEIYTLHAKIGNCYEILAEKSKRMRLLGRIRNSLESDVKCILNCI